MKSYRNYFWGSHQDWQTDINSNSVSALLPNKSNKAAKLNDTFTININKNDKRAAFAYPASSGLSCRVVDNTSHQDITEAFLDPATRTPVTI